MRTKGGKKTLDKIKSYLAINVFKLLAHVLGMEPKALYDLAYSKGYLHPWESSAKRYYQILENYLGYLRINLKGEIKKSGIFSHKGK